MNFLKRIWELRYVILFALLTLYATEGVPDMSKRMDMLHSVVLISVTNGGTGSGIIISSDEELGTSIILTAQHVIHKARPGSITVTVYPNEKEWPAEIVSKSKMYDLALIRINTYHPFVAADILLNPLEPFVPVIGIGAGMGHKPHPRAGMVEEVNEYQFYTSSPIIFGDSGGGIFTYVESEKKWFLVGLMTSVPMINPYCPVTHQAISYTIKTIQEFLGGDDD
jgi:hypothetical protein